MYKHAITPCIRAQLVAWPLQPADGKAAYMFAATSTYIYVCTGSEHLIANRYVLFVHALLTAYY